jgi:hypothetical protein
MANPMNQYHRDQRKKEVKKNKGKRIKARDERVIETQTAASINKDISVLEKKKKAKEGHLDNTEQRALERLHKELKIVTQHEEERKAAEAAAAAASYVESTEINHAALQKSNQLEKMKRQQEEKFNHIDPTLSMYYHPMLNPFGAPPPGQPRMWTSRMGGTTMNPEFAGRPGDPPPPSQLPPPPPPPPSAKPITRLGPPASATENHRSNNHQQTAQRHSAERERSDRIRYGKSSERAALFPSTKADAKPPPFPKKKQDVPPPLPKPSEAVQRGRTSRALKADIWASNEEVDYYQDDGDGNAGEGATKPQHQAHSQSNSWKHKKKSGVANKDFDMNDPCCPAGEQYEEYRGDIPITGAVKKKKKKKRRSVPPVDQWFYKDSQSGNVQGPFTSTQMLQWVSAGL